MKQRKGCFELQHVFVSGEQFLSFQVLAFTKFEALRMAESLPRFLVGADAASSFRAQRQRGRHGRDGHPEAARLQVCRQEQHPDHGAAGSHPCFRANNQRSA